MKVEAKLIRLSWRNVRILHVESPFFHASIWCTLKPTWRFNPVNSSSPLPPPTHTPLHLPLHPRAFALCRCKAFPWLAVINLRSLGAWSWLHARKALEQSQDSHPKTEPLFLFPQQRAAKLALMPLQPSGHPSSTRQREDPGCSLPPHLCVYSDARPKGPGLSNQNAVLLHAMFHFQVFPVCTLAYLWPGEHLQQLLCGGNIVVTTPTGVNQPLLMS